MRPENETEKNMMMKIAPNLTDRRVHARGEAATMSATEIEIEIEIRIATEGENWARALTDPGIETEAETVKESTLRSVATVTETTIEIVPQSRAFKFTVKHS